MNEQLSYVGDSKGLMNYIGEQICEECLGTGIVYESVMCHGSNLPPEGMYDYEPRVCHCQKPDWDED